MAHVELARLARTDPRIIAVSSSTDDELAEVWSATPNRMFLAGSGVGYALEWCARLAASENRPFAFISWEEAQECFSQIREEICLERAAVTLVVEPDADLAAPVSADLAAMCQLPGLSILSPKDTEELGQMLAWCAAKMVRRWSGFPRCSNVRRRAHVRRRLPAARRN